jgi:hypothetical protein
MDTDVISAVAQQLVTISTLYDGTSTTTSTALPTTLGQAGTVFIRIPRQYTTVSTLYAGTVTSTATPIIPTVVGQTGQIIVLVPSPSTSVSSAVSLASIVSSVVPLTLD